MKTGIAQIDAISIRCPYCNEYHASEATGSQTLTHEDYDQLQRETQTCFYCGETFKTPALARKF